MLDVIIDSCQTDSAIVSLVQKIVFPLCIIEMADIDIDPCFLTRMLVNVWWRLILVRNRHVVMAVFTVKAYRPKFGIFGDFRKSYAMPLTLIRCWDRQGQLPVIAFLCEHHALIQLKALTFGFLGLKNGASGTSFNFECLIFGKLLERFAQVSTRLLQDTRRDLTFP